MPFLVISLLALLTGTLLLAKARKEQPGKFFSFMSWFFIVVGFLLFIGFVAGGICRMKHRCGPGRPMFGMERGMMKGGRECMPMNQCGQNMHKGMCCTGMNRDKCCPQMHRGNCCMGMNKDKSSVPTEIPDQVKKAFTAKFPTATDIKYEVEDKDFEVSFTEKGVEMSANFDAAGKWLETETEMDVSALPKEITGSVTKNFPGFKISEADRVEAPGTGQTYELDLIKNKEGIEVQMNPKGDILKKTPVNEDEEQD
jgi:hypothetical protein